MLYHGGTIWICCKHKGGTMMRFSIFLVFFGALFAGSATAADLAVPEDKALIQFETKLGEVTFAHKKHADLSITECKTCHHTLQPDDQAIKPCHDCHKHKAKDPEPPITKTALHTRCIGCHEYTVASGGQAGPVKKKCKLCHVK